MYLFLCVQINVTLLANNLCACVYVYVCVCVCMYVCICVCVGVCLCLYSMASTDKKGGNNMGGSSV